MKRSLRKAYVITCLRLAIGAPTTVRSAEPMPKYLQYFQEPHGVNYGINSPLIAFEQKIQTIGLVAYYGATHAKDALHKPLELIHDQLETFKTQLLQEENQILIAIKNKYNVSDQIWECCMTDIQELKTIYKDSMKRIWPGTVHDENVPADLLETIKNTLIQNGINPRSVNIVMITDQEEINTNPHTNAQAVEWVNSTHNDYDNTFEITKKYIPSSIEIFPCIKHAFPAQKISVAAHEVQHLMQQHGITKIVIQKYLNHYYDIKNEIFYASEEYDKLVQNHEQQAEIFSAIADPDIAQAFKDYRYNTFYPGRLYEEHYYNLATIDRLWKLNSWLTYLRHNSITSGVIAKAHYFAQSCKHALALN